MCIRCVLDFVCKKIVLYVCNCIHQHTVLQGLIVLEYIILNGSEQVASAARENIFAIQTLKDFRMIDTDDRDQGQHGVWALRACGCLSRTYEENNFCVAVRQLAAKIVDLLRDDLKLREQREKYAAARSRYGLLSACFLASRVLNLLHMLQSTFGWWPDGAVRSGRLW